MSSSAPDDNSGPLATIGKILLLIFMIVLFIRHPWLFLFLLSSSGREEPAGDSAAVSEDSAAASPAGAEHREDGDNSKKFRLEFSCINSNSQKGSFYDAKRTGQKAGNDIDRSSNRLFSMASVRSEFSKRYSDYNVICVLTDPSPGMLAKSNPVVKKWVKKETPCPTSSACITSKPFRCISAEFIDISNDTRKVILGQDPLNSS